MKLPGFPRRALLAPPQTCEILDFRKSPDQLCEDQQYDLEFLLSSDSELCGLMIHIEVAFPVGKSTSALTTQPAPGAGPSQEEGTFSTSVVAQAHPQEDQSEDTVVDPFSLDSTHVISSLAPEHHGVTTSIAGFTPPPSHWPNIVVPLLQPVRVSAGDLVLVRATTHSAAVQPTYTFEVKLKKRPHPAVKASAPVGIADACTEGGKGDEQSAPNGREIAPVEVDADIVRDLGVLCYPTT